MSVVIPARDAAATLGRTLDALAAQDLGEPFEVIVVDDGSCDGTAQLAERHALGARVIAGPGTGPGAARNAGAAAAGGRILAFTDADCYPSAGWLREGVAALAGAAIVQGAVDPVRTPGPFDRTVWITSEYGLYETANLFVDRRWFERVGGFVDWVNEPWRPAGAPSGPQPHFGEDAHFAWRARRMGAATAFAPRALVEHEVFPGSPHGWVRTRRRDGLFAELAVLIPELRRHMFFGRVFLNRRLAALHLAAAALLLAGRRPWLLVAVLPYLRLTAQEARSRGGRRRVTVAIAMGDVVGAVSLVRASLRARTLLL